MKKQQFSDFKKFITKRAEETNACEDEYERVINSNNFVDLLQVIKDNYRWCFNNFLFTKEDVLKYVPQKTLLDNGFYYDYSGELLNDKIAVVYDSTIQNVWGNETIQDVRGNATIQNVWDNATIQNVRDNATIQDVRDNATYRIIRWGEKPKLFMKANAFEIIQIP